MIERREVEQNPVRVSIVSKVFCDGCGVECSRPGHGGRLAPAEFAALKRPDSSGNWPEQEHDMQLCHDCADRVVEFIAAINTPEAGDGRE